MPGSRVWHRLDREYQILRSQLTSSCTVQWWPPSQLWTSECCHSAVADIKLFYQLTKASFILSPWTPPRSDQQWSLPETGPAQYIWRLASFPWRYQNGPQVTGLLLGEPPSIFWKEGSYTLQKVVLHSSKSNVNAKSSVQLTIHVRKIFFQIIPVTF